eukprot:1036503_1
MSHRLSFCIQIATSTIIVQNTIAFSPFTITVSSPAFVPYAVHVMIEDWDSFPSSIVSIFVSFFFILRVFDSLFDQFSDLPQLYYSVRVYSTPSLSLFQVLMALYGPHPPVHPHQRF